MNSKLCSCRERFCCPLLKDHITFESTYFISSFEMMFFFFSDVSLSSAVFFKCTAHAVSSVILVPVVGLCDFSLFVRQGGLSGGS